MAETFYVPFPSHPTPSSIPAPEISVGDATFASYKEEGSPPGEEAAELTKPATEEKSVA